MSKRDSSLLAVPFCMTIIMLPLIATTLHYAFEEENNSCQEGKRAGLNLSDWLKVVGFTDFAILVLAWIGGIAGAIGDEGIGTVIMFVSAYAGLFVKSIIWIIGIVIVVTSENNKCVSRETDLGVMAIVNLVLFWLTGGFRAGASGGE